MIPLMPVRLNARWEQALVSIFSDAIKKDVSAGSLPVTNDPEYAEYLEWKRWREFKAYQEWKAQQGAANSES